MHPILKRNKNLNLSKVPQKHNILNNNKSNENTNKTIVPFANNKYWGVPMMETVTVYKFLKAIMPNTNLNICLFNLKSLYSNIK